ncbi:type VI secretion system baseplate subunit TssG [Pseudoduganella sp. DS3]|uniref:Type VI secretion system baseplate subunit TssG n=1 Tax=Pseudoduganella guangdongensis TaxID=2692179 RepID=A0A6N9HNW1_9BURK|nr:type VI secretion system baseplate subunit TssG [Pseudoduganella guangdongensis]MYN04502.1 type VI secretion system baseplate subunit TssG [Pseudoduganella guangdongensis]
MHTAKRRFEPAVIERLFAEPFRFQFFQAVRMVELWLRRHGVAQEGAVANFMRFQNPLTLRFPASQIEALRAEPREILPTAPALAEALHGKQLRYLRMTPNFMGFLGSAGALPAHYTEAIAAHQLYEKDEGPRAFLDVFSTRSLSLFYEAWRKYRLELKYQLDGQDRFLPLLLALGGLGGKGLTQRLGAAVPGAAPGHGAVRDESLAFFATALRQRPASASNMARVLGEYFRVQVAATQFVGCWCEVPATQQTMLGGVSAQLGATAMIGSRVWQRDLRMRLTIGPLRRADFDAFLPGGSAALALDKLLSMFTGVTLEYEICLVLRADDVSGASLGAGARLGWDSFMQDGAAHEDRSDVHYFIHGLTN